MLSVKADNGKQPIEILALGAHCDDIEIGCGGSLIAWIAQRPVKLTWVVFSSNPARKRELEQAAMQLTAGAESFELIVHDFKDAYLPYQGNDLKLAFDELKTRVKPQLILTHYRNDLHQDHRLISELTWNTFRDHLILEYEIPKWDGDLGNPNTYVPLDSDNAAKKIRVLLEAYSSQRSKPWFSEDLFWAMLRIRGMESGSASGFAEAFYVRKQIIEIA